MCFIKNCFFYVLLVWNFTVLYAQNNYEIKVKINPLKNDKIYLGYHYGANQYVIDTAFVNSNSEALFKKNKRLPEGIYLIMLPNGNYFNIVISKNQHLSIENDTTNLFLNLKVNDEQNTYFAEYQKELYKHQQLVKKYRKLLENFPDSEKTYNERIEQSKKQINDLKEKWYKEHPDWLFLKVLVAILPTDFTFEAKEYFKHLDFADERLLFSPAFSNKLDDFFTSLPPLTINNVDSLYGAIDYILMNSLKNVSVYEEIIKYLMSQFDLSGDYPNPEAFVYMSEKYFLTGLCPWVNELFLDKLKKYISRVKTVCIGSKFPDVFLTDLNGKKVNLKASNLDYKLIIFWNPDCDHCITYLNNVKKIYPSLSEKLDVIAVLTSNDLDKWRQQIINYPWTHLYDAELHNDFIEDLFLYSTPQVFLLDKHNNIIAKDIFPEMIATFIK